MPSLQLLDPTPRVFAGCGLVVRLAAKAVPAGSNVDLSLPVGRFALSAIDVQLHGRLPRWGERSQVLWRSLWRSPVGVGWLGPYIFLRRRKPAGLENRYTRKGIVGSNPTLSAARRPLTLPLFLIHAFAV